MYAQDLEAIEATVRALELKLRDIKNYVKKEKDAIPKALAVIQACELQRRHLQHISANLPNYLPSVQSPATSASPTTSAVPAEPRNNGSSNEAAPPRNLEAKRKPSATGPSPVPRRYITQEEFESVSPYMRNRLTADKVNAALDELITRAEATAALVYAARRNRPLGNDRKHAQWLLYNFANHEGLKGKVWVLEADLKSGAALRLDKTGKALLTLLRHLGRIGEARVSAEGSVHLVYSVL